MIYYSEVKGKNVYTEDDVLTGRLYDFAFQSTELPRLTKLIIRSPKGARYLVPIRYLQKVGKRIVISKNFTQEELRPGEFFIGDNLINKQIIDIKGNKLVRVNDVLIQQTGYTIAGVDTGILGILRWFKLDGALLKALNFLKIKLIPKVLSWADVQAVEIEAGRVILKKEEEKLETLHPADLADYLEQTNIVNVKKILSELDEEYVAEVIDNLNINYQKALFKQFSPSEAAEIFVYLDPDEAVDILLTLTPTKREKILALLDTDKERELKKLLALSKTQVGELLTSEFVTVSPENTVADVLNKIKKETEDFSDLHYIYVVNKEGRFIGVFTLHKVVQQKPDTPVYKFMGQHVIVASLTTPRNIVTKKMIKYRLSAIPVLDNEKRILGIVTIDDLGENLLKSI